MVWVRMDDGFDEHPKVLGLSDKAFRAHVSAMCYCARRLTDGVVPTARIKARQARELIEAGLMSEQEGGYLIHDWLDFNPSKEQVESKRIKRQEAGRRGGKAKANRLANARASAKAKSKQSSAPYPEPEPFASTKQEPPKPPKGGSRVPTADIDAVIAHYRRYHPRARGDKKARAKIADRLKDKFSVADLQLAIDGNHVSPWHCGQNPERTPHHKMVTIFRDADQVTKFVELASGPPLPDAKTQRAALVREQFVNGQFQDPFGAIEA